MNKQKTTSEILTRYHKNPEFVMRTFRIIIAEPPSPQSNTNTDASLLPVKDIVLFISNRFLGVLTRFGQILNLINIDKKLQHDTLLSLGEIIRFMGSDLITKFRLKILSVLQSATDRAELRNTCVQIWKIFIHTVDIQSLGPLLNIIVISLESFMVTHPNEIDDILKFLLINNSSLLSIHISDLFFIDDTNASQEIKTFIVEHSDSLQMADNFWKKFQLYFKHAMHDNLNVRIYGLKYLKRLFCDNRRELNALIIGQQNVCQSIEKLLNGLMIGCRHLDEILQLTSGECLGRIGAIEPSKLSPNYAPQNQFALTLHCDDFSIMALTELCRAINLQKESKNVDSFSLAIQEILITNGVNLHRKIKLNIWEAIPLVMRSLMEPLLTSCYTVIPRKQSFGHPIYKRGKFTSCEIWTFQWVSTMIDFYITNEQTKHLLVSFKSAMKNDSNVLMSILPYVLLHTLQSATDNNLQKIYDEFHCVFNAVVTGQKSTNENKKSLQISTNDTTKTATDDVSKKCAKILFIQFDFLDQWMHKCPNKLTIEFKCVDNFVKKFDKKYLAEINYLCEEYARALMYIESFIEGADGKNSSDERLQSQLSFLSQIYAELLDTDSLEGALLMKKDKLTLTEEAMLNMALGRLQASTVCFEKMMQIGDISSINVVNMMQCYLGLNQPEIAIRVSQSLMKEMHDQNMELLLQASVEPLWRLGRWDEMDTYLDSIQFRQSQSWPVRCGEILLSFRKCDKERFLDEIVKCQLSVLNEIRSTSDQQSSYNKGYPLILKLHLITEIEGAFLALKNFQSIESTEIFDNLFDDWDGRLELLQPTAR